MRSRPELGQTFSRRFSARDLAALAFIGRGFEVMQYQLHEAVFPSRAPNVVSRFVGRATRRGLVIAERLHRVGMNRLRLTKVGVDLLVRSGAGRADDLFVPRRSVALKDLAHTVWINDIRVALLLSARPPDVISPAWVLQRRLNPAPGVVPDLLAIWKPSDGFSGFLLACEVDLGGESVQGTFSPKLAQLADEVDSWAQDSSAVVLILTNSLRRAKFIERALPTFDSEDREIVVRELPEVRGSLAVRAVHQLIQEVLYAEGRRFVLSLRSHGLSD